MIAEALAAGERPSQGPAKRRRGGGGGRGRGGRGMPAAAVPNIDDAAQPGAGPSAGDTLATSLFRT